MKFQSTVNSHEPSGTSIKGSDSISNPFSNFALFVSVKHGGSDRHRRAFMVLSTRRGKFCLCMFGSIFVSGQPTSNHGNRPGYPYRSRLLINFNLSCSICSNRARN